MAILTGPQGFHSDTSVIDSSETVPLGTKAQDVDGNEYIYLKGVADTAANSWVTFDEAHLTTLAVADAQGRVAVAMAAVVADKYGWYQIYGSATGKALASFADNGKVYLTSTAGSVDDAAVAGDCVFGAIGRSAVSGGTATFELNYPEVLDGAYLT